jgi:glycosyltransferase involved in cell wall biosynthesis
MIYKHEYLYSRFPEDLFSPQDVESFQDRIVSGLEVCKNLNVAICCLCRDTMPVLDRNMCRINRMSSFFKNADIIIVEDGSVDGTSERLLEYSKLDQRITLIQPEFTNNTRFPNDGSPESISIERSTKMSAIRNLYLDEISSKDYDYVIIVDGDLVGGWSYDGLLTSFSYDDWAAMTSNGVLFRPNPKDRRATDKIFYDTWTFRSLEDGFFQGWSAYDRIDLNTGEPPVEVSSNFGGVGIYKYDDLIKCEYRPLTFNGEVSCEHVSLHEQIRSREGKIFVNPSLLVLYSPTEYSGFPKEEKR